MSDTQPIYEIQTLRNPMAYTSEQIREAALVASSMKRGKLVLVQEPQENS